MESARKTIGSTRPSLDDSHLDSIREAVAEVASEQQTGHFAPSTHRERALNLELQQTKRQLDVANARVKLMQMGADPKNPGRPVAHVFERITEMESRLLALDDLNAKARAKAIAALVDDVKAYRKNQQAFLEDVERGLKSHDAGQRTIPANRRAGK